MKHFLANSNEDGRTSSSSDFDERNLREYYLVPFQMGFLEGNAQSYMASYNAVNKIPNTVSPYMKDIVEKEWKFDGMVCTDAGSLPNLTRQFHYYPDATAAVVGTSRPASPCFSIHRRALKDALEKQLLTQADIDRNIRGNLRMRIRLASSTIPICRLTARFRAPRNPGTARVARRWPERSLRNPSSFSRTAAPYCRWIRASSAPSR